MKTTVGIFGLVTVFVVVAAVLSAGSDVVTNYYTTVAEARSDNLFQRGWLPDILPRSGKDIRVSNDLDLNTSEGEFSVATADLPGFMQRLVPIDASAAPFSRFQKYAARMQAKGYASGAYADASSTWAFFCKPASGRCEYSMWIDRTKEGTTP